jgi:hypothetical protein
MHVNITFETDGAAFEDDFEGEIARILAQVRAAILSNDPHNALLRDTNGNTVGTVEKEF